MGQLQAVRNTCYALSLIDKPTPSKHKRLQKAVTEQRGCLRRVTENTEHLSWRNHEFLWTRPVGCPV